MPSLGVTDIFRFPTLASLAAHIDGGKPLQPTAAAPDAHARADTMALRRQMREGRRGAR